MVFKGYERETGFLDPLDTLMKEYQSVPDKCFLPDCAKVSNYQLASIPIIYE